VISGWLFALTLVTALGAGVVAGVFFAFSTFVMRALSRLPSPVGVAAMQSINIEAPTRWFMAAFVGTAAGCVALAVNSIVEWGSAHAPFLLAGAALYLVGSFGLTIAYHVPRNDALAEIDPDGANSDRLWSRYLTQWTMGNHVRALAALAATGTLMGGLRAH
jgi:uncharacterized membrane protein